jgi:hypothetical protein
MPARLPHVKHCGDLETSCADVLLYFAAVLLLNGSGPESKYVFDQAFYCRGDRI